MRSQHCKKLRQLSLLKDRNTLIFRPKRSCRSEYIAARQFPTRPGEAVEYCRNDVTRRLHERKDVPVLELLGQALMTEYCATSVQLIQNSHNVTRGRGQIDVHPDNQQVTNPVLDFRQTINEVSFMKLYRSQ